MAMSLVALERIALRFALLVGLGLLLGCAEESRGVSARPPSDLDAGLAPSNSDAGLDVGAQTVDSKVSITPDVLSAGFDLQVIGLDAQLLGFDARTSTLDSQPISVDTKPAIDSDGVCLQGLIDNGYASPLASCADNVTGLQTFFSQGMTTESACRAMVDCLVVNRCTYAGGPGDACASVPCGNVLWGVGFGAWFYNLVVPYCGEGYLYPR